VRDGDTLCNVYNCLSAVGALTGARHDGPRSIADVLVGHVVFEVESIGRMS
jgi:hypothetical protein